MAVGGSENPTNKITWNMEIPKHKHKDHGRMNLLENVKSKALDSNESESDEIKVLQKTISHKNA